MNRPNFALTVKPFFTLILLIIQVLDLFLKEVENFYFGTLGFLQLLTQNTKQTVLHL